MGEQSRCEVQPLLQNTQVLQRCGPLRKEEPPAGSPPAPPTASHRSESQDGIQSLSPPHHPPGPECSEKPKQEPEPEPCGAADPQNPHAGGVTPTPEVRLPVPLAPM